MSKDKNKLKQDRKEAKNLRNKIVGAGNTMDSYGDKFNSMKDSASAQVRKYRKNSSPHRVFLLNIILI